MRGNSKSQAGYLLSLIDRGGQSKHADTGKARAEIAKEGLTATSERIAEKTGVYSNKTNENYHDKMTELMQYCRSECDCRDSAKINEKMVTAFLAEKIEMNVSYSHFSGYCAAFGKMEQALNIHAEKTGKEVAGGMRAAIAGIRSEAKAELPRYDGHNRAYGIDGSREIINDLSREDSRIVASIQLDAGLRIAEASHITSDQLRGYGNDSVTGERIGNIDYIGKGGQHLTAQLSADVYDKLSAYVAENGALHLDNHAYYNDLKEACKASGHEYEGSHGFRYEFAQERYAECREQGQSHLMACATVSEEMGHHRVDITLKYLAMD